MQETFEIIIPTLFGIEAIVSKELYRLGYDVTRVENGRVTFVGDYDAVCRANIWLRCGERVLIKVGEFKAETPDELYEGVKALEWERFIDRSDAFPVKGRTTRSKLASDRNSQIMIKKAIADRLGEEYGITWLPEDGVTYQIQFTIIDDIVTLMIDTTGPALHKRGYRAQSNIAPLRETIAAAMVFLSFWKFEYPFSDPFCGSGTIPIEAAMFKRNIAPGLRRRFAFMDFPQIPDSMVRDVINEARSEVHENIRPEIFASDIDPEAVKLTAQNAEKAGVGDFINTFVKDARKIRFTRPMGTIITNPPYGERLSDIESCKKLYRDIGRNFSELNRWSYYILTSHEEFEKEFGRPADKRRKLYNGMLKCCLYQYYGAAPGKKKAR